MSDVSLVHHIPTSFSSINPNPSGVHRVPFALGDTVGPGCNSLVGLSIPRSPFKFHPSCCSPMLSSIYLKSTSTIRSNQVDSKLISHNQKEQNKESHGEQVNSYTSQFLPSQRLIYIHLTRFPSPSILPIGCLPSHHIPTARTFQKAQADDIAIKTKHSRLFSKTALV